MDILNSTLPKRRTNFKTGRYAMQAKICIGCGASFDAIGGRKYCSQGCYLSTIGGSGNPNHRHGQCVQKNKVCPGCGNPFTAMKRRIYCSMECSSSKLEGQGNPSFTTGYAAVADKQCPGCGVRFRGPRYRKFCSRTCSAKANIENRFSGPDGERWRKHYSQKSSGKNNRNWRDGRSKSGYGPGWTFALRRKIRARDGDMCVTCRRTAQLTVHHRDLTKTNHAHSNLITLCVPCHVKLHREKLCLLP